MENTVKNNEAEDRIGVMIDSLYDEIMVMRFQIQDMHREGYRHLSEAEGKKKAEKLEELELILDKSQENFDKIVKTRTMYITYQKKSGRTSSSQINETLNNLNRIKSNMAPIVASVPNHL